MSEEPKEITGATALCKVAAAGGVEVCFANPGTSEMHVVGALAECADIRSVLVLHENVATGAADGYSRVKRDVNRDRNAMAMTLLHLAPGLMNGLSNLHNASRGRSSILNVVGEMSTFHRGNEALLENDIESLARTVSTKYVHTSAAVDAIASDAADAIEAALRHRGVATQIVPHDLTWSRVLDSGRLSDAIARAENVRNRRDGAEDVVVTDAVRAFLREMLARAKPLARGEVLFYIGGDACGEEELRIVGDVAEALGADVVCECFFSCIERGGDMPKVQRAPYFPKDAANAFAKYKVVIFLDVPRPPTAMFGYRDSPTKLFAQNDDDMWFVDPPGNAMMLDVLRALAMEVNIGVQCAPKMSDVAAVVEHVVSEALAKSVEDKEDSLWNYGMTSTKAVSVHDKLCKEFDIKLQSTIVFNHNSINALTNAVATKLGIADESPKTAIAPKDVDASPKSTLEGEYVQVRCDSPTGALNGAKVCRIIAGMQPAGAIVVDESLTSGSTYWKDSESSARFTHMTLTGGSIGFANAAAVGVALAAPERQTIALVGDGSAQYTVQALWTQAREKLNVVTVIMDNSKYQILRVECAIQGVRASGGACDSLTKLDDPSIDWCKLAEGYGVRGVRTTTCEEFADAFARALDADGPTLIDAVLEA